ncbi:MAG TPA: T9SS type A sorting domain-containing protein [Rubricoccaceae bacterium]|nr:T9SS type A sorting domain-containing protein [Rubricoccaceae bacterium]
MLVATRCLVAFLLLGLAASASAQPTPGHCAPGTASADLDVSDVLARVFNGGNLFFGEGSQAVYVIPRATAIDPIPKTPIFAAGLWIGGKVDGEVRVAGSRYANFEFWPGPLDEGEVLTPGDCARHDRIYAVSRDDIRHYLRTGEATADLRDWPAHLGAPVLDGDGVEGNYDLAGGDQPAVWGSQAAWWVMNDAGNVHRGSGSPPLGIEVQGTAFAVALPTSVLDRATFYRYRILNRNRAAIDSAYVAFFVDPDLGDAADDYVGSDTTLGMGYAYNGRPVDYVYGAPPAVGVQVVQGPVGLPNGRDDDGDGEVDEAGERLGMTSFSYFQGVPDPSVSDPSTREMYYNYMQGLWGDGTPMTAEGNGYQTDGEITKFAFPGDPVTVQDWSEIAEDNPPGDRRFVVVTGPFRLEAGGEEEVVFAIPFAWASSNLGSVVALREAARVIRDVWELLAPARVEGEGSPPPPPLAVARPSPNPFTDRLAVRFSVPEPIAVRLSVYDVLGREVAVLVDGERGPGEHEAALDTSSLPAGVYLVRYEVPGAVRTFPVVRTR